jgi:peptidylprolyl isomerase
MNRIPAIGLLAVGWTAASVAVSAAPPLQQPKPVTTAEVIAAAKPSDWRDPDPTKTLYLELATGRVVIELSSEFAPLHVANIQALVKARYFDGLAIVRVQDDYVVQWGDPDAGRHQPAAATQAVDPEFDRPLDSHLPFDRLPDGDVYAPEVGLSEGFPVARDPKLGLMWLAHCYGMLGVGRDNDPRSGSGAELYVVIGHAPRHLDRNVALVGRVLKGIELLSSLPRGTKALGFYAMPENFVRITSIRLAADVAPGQRTHLQVMRTDTPEFQAVIESRRNRRDEWTRVPAGRIELCNVPLPVREIGP